MKATKWMLSVLGRLLQRLGDLLVRATGEASATATSDAPATESQTEVILDAKQVWLRRVAEVPAHAWQGRADTAALPAVDHRRVAYYRGLAGAAVKKAKKAQRPPSHRASVDEQGRQAAAMAPQVTDSTTSSAPLAAEVHPSQVGSQPATPSTPPQSVAHGVPVWDHSHSSARSAAHDSDVIQASAASTTGKRGHTEALAHRQPETSGHRPWRAVASALERLREFARFARRSVLFGPDMPPKSAESPDKQHMQHESDPTWRHAPAPLPQGYNAQSDAVLTAQTKSERPATTRRTAANKTHARGYGDGAPTSRRAQTYATDAQPSPRRRSYELEVVDESTDQTPTVALWPEGASDARTSSWPMTAGSSSRRDAVSGQPMLGPPRASVANVVPLDRGLDSRQPAIGRLRDSRSFPYDTPLASAATPMSFSAVEFTTAVWPDLPPPPWAHEREAIIPSWREFVRLERLDAEQRG